MKYRIIRFWTLFGKRVYVDLPDQIYGEWIIYEDKIPKYHIACFSENAVSDGLIKELLESGKWTIERIIARINQKENRRLNFRTLPIFRVELANAIESLNLDPIPAEWLKDL